MEISDNSVKEVIKDGVLIAIIRKDTKKGGDDTVYMCSRADTDALVGLIERHEDK